MSDFLKSNQSLSRVNCRIVRKKRRVAGKQYKNFKGVTVAEISLKPPCKETCRLKCNIRVSNEQRVLIHRDFWKSDRSWDSKRQFLLFPV